MTDRELLELAAKAAGIKVDWRKSVECFCYSSSPYNVAWSPLNDDGDALRLAVKLGISLTPYPIYRSDARHAVVAKQRRSGDTLREMNPTECLEPYDEDPYAATRRAIVRAAAEIGNEMP